VGRVSGEVGPVLCGFLTKRLSPLLVLVHFFKQAIQLSFVTVLQRRARCNHLPVNSLLHTRRLSASGGTDHVLFNNERPFVSEGGDESEDEIDEDKDGHLRLKRRKQLHAPLLDSSSSNIPTQLN